MTRLFEEALLASAGGSEGSQGHDASTAGATAPGLRGPLATGSSMRQAALLLHDMRPADRAWVLEQLPPSERVQLNRLLVELTSLEVPADRERLYSVLSTPRPPESSTTAVEAVSSIETVSPPPPLVRDPRNHVASAPAERVALVLKAEPPGLIASLLAVSPWPWAPDYLRPAATTGSAAGSGPPVWGDTPAVPPALAAAVVRHVARRLEDPKVETLTHAQKLSALTKAAGRWGRLLMQKLPIQRESDASGMAKHADHGRTLRGSVATPTANGHPLPASLS